MKKALGLWLVLLALTLGGVFFYINSDESDNKVESTNTKNETVVTTKNGGDTYVKIKDISAKMQGNTILTNGVVSQFSEGKNNVFFTLKDSNTNNAIKCVMFSKTNNNNTGRKELLQKSYNNGMPVNIEGEIDIYKGNLEIKVWKVFTK